MANKHMTISLRELRQAIEAINVVSYSTFAEDIFEVIAEQRLAAITDTSIEPDGQRTLDFGDTDGTDS